MIFAASDPQYQGTRSSRPWHAKHQEFQPQGVLRFVIQLGDDFRKGQEQRNSETIGDDMRQHIDRLILYPQPCAVPDDQEDQNDQRRAGCKRRYDEADGHHVVVPHRPRRHRTDQKSRYGVDAQGPDDGDIDQRQVELVVQRQTQVFPVQEIKSADQVQQHVADQHQGVPGQHRVGKIVDTDNGQHVPEPVGPSHMGEHEQDAHDDRRNCQHLAQHRHLMQGFMVVDVGGENDGHCPGGNADQENQIRQIQAVADLAGHAGVGQPFGGVQEVPVQKARDQSEKKKNPGVEHHATLDYVEYVVKHELAYLVPEDALQASKQTRFGKVIEY